MTTAAIQPAVTGTFLIDNPRSTSSLNRSEPPGPMSFSGAACRARKNASVTTNDGMPSRETRRPIASPMIAPIPRPASTASHHDQPWSIITSAVMVAEAPPATPADRSISPSSRTKTRPIASTMIEAAWTTRLAML